MKRLLAVLTLSTALLFTGCAKQHTGVPLTQAQQIRLTANQSLATVAAVNKAVAATVRTLSDSGVIQRPLAVEIVHYNDAVAQAGLAAIAVQQSDKSVEEKALAVQLAFVTLPKLPSSVKTFAEGQQTVPAVVTLVASIQTIQALVKALAGER